MGYKSSIEHHSFTLHRSDSFFAHGFQNVNELMFWQRFQPATFRQSGRAGLILMSEKLIEVQLSGKAGIIQPPIKLQVGFASIFSSLC